MPRTQSIGWQVTLTHPDTGRKTEPDLLGDPEFRANPRGLPEARIPVSQTPEWARDWDGAAMRVVEDGDPAPIDQLDRVEVEQGQTILVGIGGVELREVVAAEFDIQPAYEAAESLVQNETGYTANFDAPDADVNEDVLFQSVDSTAEWDAALDGTIPDTNPHYVENGLLKRAQTAFIIHARDDTTDNGSELIDTQSNTYIDANIYEFSDALIATGVNDIIETEYAIPYDELAFGIKYELVDEDPNDAGAALHQGFETKVDGQTLTTVSADILNLTSGAEWRTEATNAVSGNVSIGSVDIDLDFNDSSGGTFRVDAIAIWDQRYHSQPPNTVDNNEAQAFDTYASGGSVETDDVTTIGSFDAAELQTSVNDATNLTLGLSTDRGDTFTRASDTDTVSATFGGSSNTLRTEFALAGVDLQGATGDSSGGGATNIITGIDTGHEVDLYELFADVDLTTLVIDYSEEQRLVDHLNAIAGDEYLWEVARAADGSTSIEWAKPEQRVADDTPALTDLTVQKNTERITDVTVRGANQRVSDERFTASASYVDLSRNRIIPQTESVYDGTGTDFERGEDYEVGWDTGEIRVLDTGDMVVGDTYRIDYQAEIRGRRTATPNDGTAEVVEVPAVASERAAAQLADYLVDEFSVPRWQATARIPPQTGVFSAIEAINVGLADELPDDAFPLSPRTVKSTPEGLVVALGRVTDFASAVSELSGQLQSVSKRV